MEKITMYIMALILAVAVAVSSCTKEGPAGKDGIDGVDGKNGKDGKDGKDGRDGKNGNVVITGNGAPNSGLGNTGDYYFDRLTSNLYGAKTANGWGTPISLKGLQGEKGDKGDTGEKGNTGEKGDKGTDGNRILSGTTIPTDAIGKVGDWYINTQNGKLYGAKTNAGWGNGINLNINNHIQKGDFILSKDGLTLLQWVDKSVENLDLSTIEELKNLKRIGARAFYDCEDLTSIKFNENLVSIERGAFKNNRLLETVEFPSSLRSIGESAFESCTSLYFLNLNYGILSIGDKAFKGCEYLRIRSFPATLTTIGVEAFLGCYLRAAPNGIIEIPESVSGLGFRAFGNYPYKTPQEFTVKFLSKIPPKILGTNYTAADRVFHGNRIKKILVPRGSGEEYEKIGSDLYEGGSVIIEEY